MPSSRQPPRPDVSLADIVTIGNAVCGFLAIAVAARVWTGAPAGEVRMSQHDVVVAAALIIPGGLLDSVDGAVARWRGGSVLGPHLEVMSDAVTFGVAPSVLFAVDAAAYGEPWAAVALVVAAAYAVAVLLRLARYAAPSDAAHAGLRGLPSPPSAMAALSIIVLHPPAPLALGAMVALALLMGASFPFPRISAATAPLMGVWWAAAAAAAVGLVPPEAVAVLTLAAVGGLLVVAGMHAAPSPRRP